MIKNERQYRITKKQADGFSRTLNSLTMRSPASREGLHPLIARAQEEAVRSQLADLQKQLRQYESLKAGNFDLGNLSVVEELPSVLIQARIALGLSQKDLARKLHLKEQQIQRYEATDYSSASLARIREVASALEAETAASIPAAGSR